MKRVFILAAIAAVALSSCSKSEVFEVATPNENPNAIGLTIGSFVSKAGETTTAGLNLAGNKITIYSNDTKFGSLEFLYSDSNWSNGKTWEDVAFPLYLYSMNTGVQETGNLALTVAESATSAAAAAYKVLDASTTPAAPATTDAAGQADLVYYGSKLAAIPTGGSITATFKHALSRIKMQAKAAANYDLYISSVRLVNFDGSATPTISFDTNGASQVAWVSDNANSATAYNYYFDADATDATTGKEYAFSAATAVDFDATVGGNIDRYIIPQSTTGVTLTEGVADAGAYVEVIYCAYVSDIPLAGCKTGIEHPQYDGSVAAWTALASTPLYAKVAFPATLELVDGTYYNLILDFTGGDIVYIEDGYVDEDGDAIAEFPGDAPEAGAKVNVDAQTTICLSVTALEWSDTTGETLGDDVTEGTTQGVDL